MQFQAALSDPLPLTCESSPLNTRRTSSTSARFHIRRRTEEDAKAIPALMRRVYPPPHGPESIWKPSNLLKHLEYFPEGQFVADAGNGQLIGSATTMRTTWERGVGPHTWLEITGGGTLETHQPQGPILYGVDIAVDPAHQGIGVGSQLYATRLDLGRELGCAAFAAGARVPGYAAYAKVLSIREYLEAVVHGDLFDSTLSKQIQLGFTILSVLPRYARDPETHGFAALIFMRL